MMLMTTQYIHRCPFTIEAVSMDVPLLSETHPNKAPFRGILTRLDEPSTRSPTNADGRRVIIPTAVAQRAGNSIINMPVDCTVDFQGHNKRLNIGVMTGWSIEGKDFIVEGHLFEKNFPQEVRAIRAQKSQLGMSYEIGDVEVEDVNAPIWILQHFIFTGAAILRKDAAAYAKTAIAAQADEDRTMEANVLDEIQKLGTKIDVIIASQEEDDEEAAAAQAEEEAKCHDDEASAAHLAAKRAMDDADEEDAQKHAEAAKSARTQAFAKREKAMNWHASMAAKKREAGDEDAAASHEEAAARMKKADEDAKCKDEEASASLDAAKSKPEDEDGMTKMMGMFMRAMMQMKDEDGSASSSAKKAAKKSDDDDMGRLFSAMVKAMTYAPTMSAEHDDEEEDKALIRRMLRQERGGNMAASKSPIDLKTKRQIRDLQASVELLTDAVKKVTNLLTDGGSGVRGLSTDKTAGGVGGGQAPARKTMQAGGMFTDKYADARNAQQGRKPGQMTELELNAAMDQEGVKDPTQRMARIIEAQASGLLVS